MFPKIGTHFSDFATKTHQVFKKNSGSLREPFDFFKQAILSENGTYFYVFLKKKKDSFSGTSPYVLMWVGLWVETIDIML